MEQYFWYGVWTYVFSMIVVSAFFGNKVKSFEKDLVEQKIDYEKKNASLSAHFNRELLKLKFELNNKPKYAVGNKFLNDSIIILDFHIGESDPYVSDMFRVYSNRYEVFDSNKNIKIVMVEKDLEELIRKATV